MKWRISIGFAIAAAIASFLFIPSDWITVVALSTGVMCVALAMVDTIAWNTIRNLDDFIKAFDGNADELEEVADRISSVKKEGLRLFIICFLSRSAAAAITLKITQAKTSSPSDPYFLAVAIFLAVVAIPVLIRELMLYVKTSDQLAGLYVRARREKERKEELERLAKASLVPSEPIPDHGKVNPWPESKA